MGGVERVRVRSACSKGVPVLSIWYCSIFRRSERSGEKSGFAHDVCTCAHDQTRGNGRNRRNTLFIPHKVLRKRGKDRSSGVPAMGGGWNSLPLEIPIWYRLQPMSHRNAPQLNLILGRYSARRMLIGWRAAFVGSFQKSPVGQLVGGVAGAANGATFTAPAHHQKMAENCGFWVAGRGDVEGSPVEGSLRMAVFQGFARSGRLIANLPNGRNGAIDRASTGRGLGPWLAALGPLIAGGLSLKNGGFPWGAVPLSGALLKSRPVAQPATGFLKKVSAKSALPTMIAFALEAAIFGWINGVRGAGKDAAHAKGHKAALAGDCALGLDQMGSGVLLGWSHPKRTAQGHWVAWGRGYVNGS